MTDAQLTQTMQIAQVVACTEAEGPGKRFAVWFQGCPLRCPGCCNPEFLPFRGGQSNRRRRNGRADRRERGKKRASRGSRFSEANRSPTQRVGVALARIAKEMSLSVMVFSGYTIEELRGRREPEVAELIALTDILVDGPYDRDRPDTERRWIGSTNQRIHFLTDRYSYDEQWRQEEHARDPRQWPRDQCEWFSGQGCSRLVEGMEATETASGNAERPARNGREMTRTAAPPTRPPEPDGPRQVSRFEFNLLRILRFMVGQFPADQGIQLVRAPIARPECLSRGAVELVQDTLAKACVLFLVRQGGWRNERYLRGNVPTPGRVWQRIPLDERSLTFSPPGPGIPRLGDGREGE